MCFVKCGIQLLVMRKHFILLVVFNQAAHNNNCLPHEEHKKTAEQSKHQYRYPCNGHNTAYAVLHAFYFLDKGLHQYVVGAPAVVRFVVGQLLLHIINNKTHYLRRQYAEIIGDNDKKNSDTQPELILPEIFIKRLKMLQSKTFGKSSIQACRFTHQLCYKIFLTIGLPARGTIILKLFCSNCTVWR